MVLSQPAIRASLVLGMCVLWTAHAGEPPSHRDKIKAGFLYNFAKFSQWPAETFSRPGQTFNFCILGNESLSSAMLLFSNKMVNSHPIDTRPLVHSSEVKGCHLLYIGSSQQQNWERILARLEDAAVLTVAEFEKFVLRDGTVRIFEMNNRLRFEINVRAARSARISISSKLLSLATTVHH